MKILRYVGDLAASIFAKDAQNETRAIFGDENPSDDLTANIDNQKFREGWDLRITRPTVQDFNALGYSLNTLIAYLHQMGVPEWDSAQAYYKNSITNFGGSLFVSLVDDNVGINPVSGKDAVLSWANISGGGGGTGPVDTVFGRVGNITSQDGDYDLGLIGDVDLTTNPPANTYVLTYNEAEKKWEAMPSTAGGVPDGGDTGEILVKNSPIEKDADWSKTPLLAGNILDALLDGTTHGIALGYEVLKSAASKVVNGNVFIGKGVGENHTGAVSDSVVIGHAASADKIESDAVAIGSESQTGAGGVSIGSHAGAGAGGVSIGQNAGSQSDDNTIAIGADVDAFANAFDSSDSILVSTNKYKTTEESSGSIVLETPKGSIKYIGGGDFIFSNDVRAPAFYGDGTGLTGIMFSFNGRTGKVSAQDGDYNLKGLADVGVATPADGQILRYSKDRGVWENADQVVNYPVASVFGRTGEVVAAADDYDLNMLGDVDTAGANTNHILAYNQGRAIWESKVFEAGDVYFHNDKANHIKADTFDTAKALNDLDQAIMPPSGIAGLYDATDNKFTRVTNFGLTLGFVEGDDIPTAQEKFEGAEIIVAVDGKYGGFDCFIGDTINYNLKSNIWEIVDRTHFKSFNGRAGEVVAEADDYALDLLADVAITTPVEGHVLKYDGTEFVNNENIAEDVIYTPIGDADDVTDATNVQDAVDDIAIAVRALEQGSVLAGTYDAENNVMLKVTGAGLLKGFAVDADLPLPTKTVGTYFVYVETDGEYDDIDLAVGNKLICDGMTNQWIKLASAQGGSDAGPVSKLVDDSGRTRVEATDDGADVNGTLHIEPENDIDAIQIVGPRESGLGIGYHDAIGIEFKSYNQSNIKFRIESRQGTTSYPVTIGYQLIAFDELVRANYGINLGDSSIKKLQDPVDDQDAVNLRTLNKKLSEGGGGAASELVDENGISKIKATTDGTETTGRAVIKNDDETKTWLELNQNENTELSILYDSQNPHVVIKDDKHLAFSYLDDETYKPVSIFRKDQILFLGDVACMANAKFDYEIEVDENAKIHGNLIVDQLIEAKNGIDANNTPIKQVADAEDDADAVNLKQMLEAIAAGGGEGGPTSKLVDENLKVRVEATTDGTVTVGTAQIQNEYGNDKWLEFENYGDIYMEFLTKDNANHIASHVNTNLYFSFNDNGKYNTCAVFGNDIILFNREVMHGASASFENSVQYRSEDVIFKKGFVTEGIARIKSKKNEPALQILNIEDDSEKFKIDHGMFGITFNNFGDYIFNRNNRSVLELTEKSASFQQKIVANGGLQATDAKVASLVIDNYLDNVFLQMKKDERTPFEWRTRSNQNQLVIPSSDVYQIMFNKDNNLTTAISFGTGLAMAYADFVFNGFVSFKKDVNLNSCRLTNIKSPQSATDAASKEYVDSTKVSSIYDLDDVNAVASDPLRDDDVLTWDSEVNHFRFISKHEFKYAIDATKGVQACADLVAHYVAYVSAQNNEKKTIFHMKTNSTQHRYTTQQGATHIFSCSPVGSDQATDLVFIGQNGNLFIKKAQFNAGISLFDNRIESVGDPENPKDAVNLEYLRDYVANHGGTNDEGQIGALDHLQFDGRKVFEVESNAYCLLQDKTDEELLALRVGYDSNTNAINYEARYGTMFQFHSFDEEDENKTLLFKMNRGAARFKVKAYCDAGIDCVNTRIANLRDPSYDGDAVNRKYMQDEIKQYVNDNAEMYLGKPEQAGYILSSSEWGERSWIPLPNDKVKMVYTTDDNEAITTSSDKIHHQVLTVFENDMRFRSESKYKTRFVTDTSENAFKIENRHGTQFQIVSYDDSDMNPKKLFKVAKDETKFYERVLFQNGISCGTAKITNLAPPTDPKDAANMQWVQQQMSSVRSSNSAAVKLAEVKLEKALTRIRDLEEKLSNFEEIMKVYEAKNKNLAK